MKTKIILTLFIVLAIAVVSFVVFFISRPHQEEELLPLKFAELQVPERPKQIIGFHNGYILDAVAFSPVDSTIIATTDQYGTVKLWNTNDIKNEIAKLSHPGFSTSINFSPTGKILVSSNLSEVILWDVATGQKLNSLDGSSGQIAFSPDGNILAIPTKNNVTFWDIRNPKSIKNIDILPFKPPNGGLNRGAKALDISSDGKWIAVVHNNGIVNVWDYQNKQLVKTLEPTLELEGSFIRIDTIKFSPDNRYLAICVDAAGCILWTVSEWKYHGEIHRARIEGLSFSPDGKMFAIADPISLIGKGIELRLSENCALIASLPGKARDVAFSHNEKLIATTDQDGFFRLWKIKPNQYDLDTTPSNVIRLMYIVGSGKSPQPGITSKLDRIIREVQQFYADEMERHGFGRKTFTFETDENGKVKIYLIESELTKGLDFSNNTWLAVSDDYDSFNNISRDNDLPFIHKMFSFLYSFSFKLGSTKSAISNNIAKRNIKGANYEGLIHVLTRNLNSDRIAYELRRAFNIPYVYRIRGSNFLTRVFSGGNEIKLSKCEAEWLERNRYFTPNQTFFDKAPEIDLRISPSEFAETRNFQFDVSDEDGIHQAQLYVPLDLEFQSMLIKLHDCHSVNGKKKANVVFEITDPEIKQVKLQMIDMLGNIASREFHITEETSQKGRNITDR